MPETVERKGEPKTKGRALLTKRYDPLTSLVLVVPVFLIYHLGILFMDRRNGVDMASVVFFGMLKQSVGLYIGVTLAIAAALIGAGFYLRRKGRARVFAFVPILIESTVWAIGLAVTVGWATSQLVPNATMASTLQMAPAPLGPLEKVVMSAGAGFHEELVFRVILFGGMAFFLRRVLNVRATWSFVTALVVSSVIFSAIHYLGALGDTFTLASFVFRFFAGVYLALLFRFRGFAVAVYAHALFDIIVLFFIGD